MLNSTLHLAGAPASAVAAHTLPVLIPGAIPGTIPGWGAVLGAGFVVAFLHTALPTHWLPFVLTARLRRWTTAQAVGAGLVAALAHVLATAVLGAVLTLFGLALQAQLGGTFALLTGGVMIALGLWLAVQAVRKGHRHSLVGHTHGEPRQDYRTDRAAVLGLAALMLFSPCEAFLPIYLADARLGWTGFALLSASLAAATLLGMSVFIALSLAGVRHLRLEKLERYEGAAIGVALALLGVAILFSERLGL